MHLTCPEQNCHSNRLCKDGFYHRKSDRRTLQRWKCRDCGRRFSAATFSLAFNQNKRHVNNMVMKMLCSSVSMRRIAILLGIHRTTVARKLTFLARVAEEKLHEYLSSMPKAANIQFDDLITFEHTKCKGLSVSVAVEKGERKVLGVEVSSIPAPGRLKDISRKKYGPRPSKRNPGILKLFNRIKPYTVPVPFFETDEDTAYPGLIQKVFAGAGHRRYKSAPGRDRGLGELKKLKYDPLFSVNHTLAMFRANINRLFRKTWCTTKKQERLAEHLAVYCYFHNTVLT